MSIRDDAYRVLTTGGVKAPRESIRFPLLLWIGSRLALMICSFLSVRFFPRASLGDPWPAAQHEVLKALPFIDGFCRWDCEWYLRIATFGYRIHPAANYWPLYPLVSRGFHEVTRLPLIASLIVVANLACLASWIVLYRLFRRLEGEAAARWALSIYAAFPFAFAYAAGYAESLAVLCSALAIGFALDRKPIRAGIMLGLAVLARHLMMIGGVALLVVQVRERGWKKLFAERGVIGLVIPWIFAALYPLWLSHSRLHDAWAFVTVRSEGWHREAWMSTWVPLLDGSVRVDVRYWIYPLVSLVPALGTILLAMKKRWELFAMSALYLCVCWTIGAESLGRHSAACWPAFLPLGVLAARHRRWAAPLLVVMVVFQFLFFHLFMHVTAVNFL